MPRKQPTTLAECNAELELAQKQLRQYQNREKVLTRKLFVEERRIRTHRLCARGGYLESIVPELIAMTDEEAKDYLYHAVHSEEAIRGYKTQFAQAERRLAELDRLFIRIYEDNVSGRITDERFSMMSRTYEDEQTQLKVEIQSLQQEIEVQERQIENLEQFIQRVHKYEDLQELTPYALRELVKAIYIEAPDKSSGKRRQNIRISYDLVGFIPLNELVKEETA